MKFVLFNFLILSMSTFGQLPLDLKKSACDKSMIPFVDMSIDHLKSVNLEKQLLSLEIGIIENCDFRFSFNASLSANTDTLFIKYEYQPIIEKDSLTGSIITRESIAMCDCFFDIELSIDSIKSIPSVILLAKSDSRKDLEASSPFSQLFILGKNGLPIIPEKFKKQSKSYNQLDENGNKIGIWKSESDKFIAYTQFMKSTNLVTLPFWTIVYNHNNELKYFEVFAKNGQYSLNEKEQKLLEEKVKSIRNNE